MTLRDRLRGWLGHTFVPPEPAFLTLRSTPENRAAIVFLHGFGGDAAATWGRFPEFLEGEPCLRGWDLYSVGYASTLRIDVPDLWDADPPLVLLSRSLRTALDVPPLKRYQSLALVAHSMGGLVAQHALIDDVTAARVGHLVLFGTPSAGLGKALLGSLLKRQARDMFRWSPFVLGLRWRWRRRYGARRPFVLRVVAGERDEFVPARSSLRPFADGVQRVVPGNHLAIVKPAASDSRSVQLVVATLCDDAGRTAVDSALVAVERREFARAVDVLLPRADVIDDDALVQLALALEGLGRGDEALGLLERRYRGGTTSTDALGVLGGRLKRRWLVGRVEADWQRARELYMAGLTGAESDSTRSLAAAGAGASAEASPVDVDQAMYHAINIAFLDLMHAPAASSIPASARTMAEKALTSARHPRAKPGHWNLATQGDALAMLGQFDEGCKLYVQARRAATSPREIDSMYAQAERVAMRLYGAEGAARVREAFGIPTTAREAGA